jgi:hypothetical protein
VNTSGPALCTLWEPDPRENTPRSAAAEFGVNEPTVRIDSSHVGNSSPYVFQKEEDALSELVHILVIEGRAAALGEVEGHLLLELGDEGLKPA